ncbi:MAG: esterase-like activity of phytase family protein, partial [Pseudobdellovibrionaceae bacterium]
MRTSRILNHKKTQGTKLQLKILSLSILISACAATPKKEPALAQRVTIETSNEVGVSAHGEKIFLGGFSGLRFVQVDPQTGEDVFITHTDRGPNAEPIKNKKGQEVRPFLIPSFQPKIVWIRVNKERTSAKVDRVLSLYKANGKTVSGLPNKMTDEIPVDAKGQKLKRDMEGLDLEAIALEADGSFWMGDEYGPSLVHFDKDGKWLDRYDPGNGLPEVLKFRKDNRGFEGIAIKGKKIYAFLQSPLNLKDTGRKTRGSIRIIEFDLDQKKTTGQYVYFFS